MPNLKTKLKSLPENPGVYRFYDSTDTILYVGKAKNLKKRVNSYFNKTAESGKTRVLVNKIANIEYMVTNNELDALLLENNLIKEYQPRYNILLKDDKSFPWICVTNERFPQIYSIRNPQGNKNKLLGPFASVKTMNTLLKLVRRMYQIRTCKFALSKENVEKGKFKVCLEYHIGNCKGPCENLQTEADYNEMVEQSVEILKGNMKNVVSILKNKIKLHASNLEFEAAQKVKDKLEHLERYQAKSTIVNPAIKDVEIFSLAHDNNTAYVNFLKVIDGSIVKGQTLTIKKTLDESASVILERAIGNLRFDGTSTSKEILVPIELEMESDEINFNVPQRGDKHKLLLLSERNAKQYMLEKQRQIRFVNPDAHAERIIEQAKKDLRLKVAPTHIECFDNSNIQGTNPVAACVVFKNAKASKKDYRHFNIKTVEGPDDFASMTEVVGRRYSRLIKEDQPLPQLIVIDGGKGQLSAAYSALVDLNLQHKIAIIGIAKRLEEIYFPGDSLPIYLDKRSETLKLIQLLRNEAHRFGITHHRNRRSKSSVGTELTNIEGIGEGTAKKLLSHFKSTKRVKEASLEELVKIVGQSKANIIIRHVANK